MFAEDSRLSPLESRKQLLVAESELNRAQSLQEWESMTSGVRTLASRARAWSSLVSSAASLVAGLLTFRRGPSMLAAEKPSWIGHRPEKRAPGRLGRVGLPRAR